MHNMLLLKIAKAKLDQWGPFGEDPSQVYHESKRWVQGVLLKLNWLYLMIHFHSSCGPDFLGGSMIPGGVEHTFLL